MKYFSPKAVCLGAIMGFVGCCVFGHSTAQKSFYKNFLRLHRFLEQESSYYPTASQLAAVARAQCPPKSGKTLVVIGGNSVFNGSGQKHDELWSRVLQTELGDGYHVINFSGPGAGVVDNGAVIFEMLSRDYLRSLLVTNTEAGYYFPPERTSYSYLFWDAYYKGLLLNDTRRAARIAGEKDDGSERELRLGRRLNSAFYFNDLWTYVSYRYVSTVWTSWLKDRSFRPRRRLPDWYDKRPPIAANEDAFQKMLPGHIEALRTRKTVAPDRFQQNADGTWTQTTDSLHLDEQEIAELLPQPLVKRSLIVLTP